ncbi:hypothetical protein LAE98_13440 [Bacillus wiedmannii]|uniref:hypothetical protein n=1 Tax=Bacillus wiedmannii TaxID=1890302 RepID=UPI001CBB64ED|nr:hypothetical protein [Bacillus wiedmannii]MBZ4223067.1 hypothetical protein [Bacillus wiedmannii]
MPWFLNTDTDVTWEVTVVDHVKRCKNDPAYEEVDEPKQETIKKKRQTPAKPSE